MAGPGKEAPKGGLKKEHVEVASVGTASETDVAKLRAQIATLTEQLGAARSESEQRALAAAEAQGMLMQRDIQEVATGKTVSMERCKGYRRVGYSDGRPVREPVFEEAEVPTYFYKIDIPPVGGVGLIRNGRELYHGIVYSLDIYTLRDVKEQVARLWDHERNISGSNENFYRPRAQPTLSAREA